MKETKGEFIPIKALKRHINEAQLDWQWRFGKKTNKK